MANGKIKTLFSDEAKTEALFPRTKTSAVSDQNGVGLDALLSQVNDKIDSKATENFVLNKIAEAKLNGGDVDLSGYATKDELNALTASDVGALPSSGGTISGALTLNGKIYLSSNSYGSSLPSTGTAGQIFFKKV